MYTSRYFGNYLLLIGGIVVILGILSWAFYPSPGGADKPEIAKTVPSIARKEIATSSREEPQANRSLSNGAVVNPLQASVIETPFFLPIDGNGKENAAQTQQAWLRLDPLARVLTPISAADERWLIENRYPRPSEYRAIRDPKAVISQIEGASRAGNYAEVSRLHDLLTAYFYEKGDMQWQYHASLSDSAFGARLLAEEMLRNIQPGLQNAREVASFIARVQALGDPNVVDSVPMWLAPQAQSAWEYMRELNENLRQIEAARQLHVSRGRIPHTQPTTPRPQATWGRKY